MGRAPAPGRAREAAVHPGGLAAPRSVPAHTWDVGTSTWSVQGLLLLLPAPAAAGDSEVPGGGPAQRPQPVRARPGVQAQPEGGSTSSGSVGLVCASQPSSGVRVGPTSQSCGEMAASLARAAGWHPATTPPRLPKPLLGLLGFTYPRHSVSRPPGRFKAHLGPGAGRLLLMGFRPSREAQGSLLGSASARASKGQPGRAVPSLHPRAPREPGSRLTGPGRQARLRQGRQGSGPGCSVTWV